MEEIEQKSQTVSQAIPLLVTVSSIICDNVTTVRVCHGRGVSMVPEVEPLVVYPSDVSLMVNHSTGVRLIGGKAI